MTLFIETFTTLLAIINPLEALPIFLGLVAGKDERERLHIARRACLYALLLMFFFLVFGTVILRVFGIPLSMVRIVGGIILVRLGFTLFSSSSARVTMGQAGSGKVEKDDDVAFVPLALPIMFGPGAIATILGMTSLVKQSEFKVVRGDLRGNRGDYGGDVSGSAGRQHSIGPHRSTGNRRRHAQSSASCFRHWYGPGFSWDDRSLPGQRSRGRALTLDAVIELKNPRLEGDSSPSMPASWKVALPVRTGRRPSSSTSSVCHGRHCWSPAWRAAPREEPTGTMPPSRRAILRPATHPMATCRLIGRTIPIHSTWHHIDRDSPPIHARVTRSRSRVARSLMFIEIDRRIDGGDFRRDCIDTLRQEIVLGLGILACCQW